MREPSISSVQRGVHTLGRILVGAGLVTLLVCFLGVWMTSVSGGMRDALWVGFPVGVVLIALGQTLRDLGAAGVAGSGRTLDPEGASEDFAPWAHAGGKLVKDAMQSSGSAGGQIIRVRCRGCMALNEEHAKSCSRCGAAL